MSTHVTHPPHLAHAAHAADNAVPRLPLLAAGALVVLSLIGVTAARYTGIGVAQVVDAPAVTVREFLFEDRSDGGIDVLDASSRQVVDTVAPGSNGFLRGTMRGLARERKRQGVSASVPFQLIGRSDGGLTLIDPATQRRVDLGSFGPSNAAVFSQLMSKPQPNAAR
jgi:putative photosynthetic complex assembly protein